MTSSLRSLVIVLGDQLDRDSSAFDGFDPTQDAVWMAEVREESTHVWSTQARIAMVLAAMRHFAQALVDADLPLHYTRLGDAHARDNLAAELQRTIERHRPTQLVMCAPGDWRVLQSIQAVAAGAGLPLDLRIDRHSSARCASSHHTRRASARCGSNSSTARCANVTTC